MGVIYCFLIALTFQDIPVFRILIHCSTLRGIELLEHGSDFDSDLSCFNRRWLNVPIGRQSQSSSLCINARVYAGWRPHGQLDLKPRPSSILIWRYKLCYHYFLRQAWQIPASNHGVYRPVRGVAIFLKLYRRSHPWIESNWRPSVATKYFLK